jgi:uroporphyrinogen decarboxylase
MDKKSRVMAAIDHKETDRIPHNIEITRDYLETIEQMPELCGKNFFDWAGNHIDKCNFESGDYVEEGIYKDEFGVIWDRRGEDKDIGHIQEYLLHGPDMKGYPFPSIDEKLLTDRCETFFRNQKDTFNFVKMGTTLFERAWSLRGLENLFMDFLLEEKFIDELFEMITDRIIQMLDVASGYPFDGVYFGDDYGQQQSLMMSPDVWRKCIKPQLKKMFEKAKSNGLVVCLHSCGNIYPILGDLIDIGLDVYQTVQPEIYDLPELKAEFGNDLAFYGAISTQRDLPFKSPTEIKDIVKATMDIWGGNGGYIAAPTHRITKDIPFENIAAMVEVFSG